MKDKNICNKSMNFKECEKLILNMRINEAKTKIGRRIVNLPDIKEMIEIVEDFLRRKKLLCYGGTALNNILPLEEQFYDKDVEISDYDFYSSNALDDSKELANIFHDKGYTEIEAKSGTHHGTYKVFVNFIPIADITNMPKKIFDILKKESIEVDGIHYCPPNFLRMAVYLELSRPVGDVDRWPKVLERVQLLNKHYPLTTLDCKNIEFQREIEKDEKEKEHETLIYNTVRTTLVNQGCVFFGGYALSNYSEYMPSNVQEKVKQIPDFDILSHEPKQTAEIVKERLREIGVKNIKIIKHDPLGEIIPLHYEIKIGKEDTIAFIYKPIACHSYNVLFEGGQKVKIATIDTILSFYLAFLYGDRKYYYNYRDRFLCMADYLFKVQQKNRLEQKGLLRRFSITCYGHQETLEEMRAEKAKKYKELRGKKGTREYEEWFLNYNPSLKKERKTEDKIEEKTEEQEEPTNNTKEKASVPFYKKFIQSRKPKKGKFAFYNKTRKNRKL